MKFQGAGAERSDQKRLQSQMERIRLYMLGVGWLTLNEIQRELEHLYQGVCFPHASISAQLRNLKKRAGGSHILEKRRRGGKGGLWEYHLLPPVPQSVEHLLLGHQKEMFS